MTISISFEAEPLAVKVDAFALVDDLARTMTDHYKRSLRSGQNPAGGGQPRNKDGSPKGRGDGSIYREWPAPEVSGTKLRAEASTGPDGSRPYKWTVEALEKLGASVVTTKGRAGALIDAAISRAADAMVSS